MMTLLEEASIIHDHRLGKYSRGTVERPGLTTAGAWRPKSGGAKGYLGDDFTVLMYKAMQLAAS